MPATKILPSNYHHQKTLDLSSSRVVIWLNLAAIPLLIVYGFIFARAMVLLRSINPFPKGVWGVLTTFSGWDLIALILSIIFMLVFHELVHGLFFWLFTRERPKFALKAGYAFAAAPDWYLPSAQYVIVGLSPLVVISLLSIVSAVFVPASIVAYLLYIATFNAAGALGDMIVVAWVLNQSNTILVRDAGDTFSSFAPGND
jgi:Putative zincin peptidase